MLEGRDDESRRTQPLFDCLGLGTGRYEVGTYWKSGHTQIDLIVLGLDDREVRIIEAKWIARRAGVATGYLTQLLDKRHPQADSPDWHCSRYLALSKDTPAAIRRHAARDDIHILQLSDLF